VNPVAPVGVHVSDEGWLATLDNWHEVGYGLIAVFYDPNGRSLRYWQLSDLFTPEQRLMLTRTVSSIWWHFSEARFGEGLSANILTVPVGQIPFTSQNVSSNTNAASSPQTSAAFQFDARTGALLSRPTQ
jgi:hypothetical protein